MTNKMGYVCGDSVTIADLRIHQIVTILKSGRMVGIPAESMAPYPELLGHCDRIESLPLVAEWRAKYGQSYDTFDYEIGN